MLSTGFIFKLLKINLIPGLIKRGLIDSLTMIPPKGSFVWIDTELTGLDVTKDRILEIACIITKPDLEYVHEGINLIIHQPDEVLNSMNEWCIENHGKTGLTDACRKSKLTEEEAEKTLYDYILKHTESLIGNRYLAGNTIYMDRKYIEKYMPSVDNLFHYRLIDVTTVKELCRSWYPEKYNSIPPKNVTHRAIDDIRESINELQAYRRSIFK